MNMVNPLAERKALVDGDGEAVVDGGAIARDPDAQLGHESLMIECLLFGFG